MIKFHHRLSLQTLPSKKKLIGQKHFLSPSLDNDEKSITSLSDNKQKMICVYSLKKVVVFHYQINDCVLILLPFSTQADGLNFAKEMLLSTGESATFSASEIERRLHSDLRNGLTWQEALGRSKIIGYNELQAPQEDSTFKKYVEQFKNPLILLLLGKFESF